MAQFAERVGVMYAGRLVELGAGPRDFPPSPPPLHADADRQPALSDAAAREQGSRRCRHCAASRPAACCEAGRMSRVTFGERHAAAKKAGSDGVGRCARSRGDEAADHRHRRRERQRQDHPDPPAARLHAPPPAAGSATTAATSRAGRRRLAGLPRARCRRSSRTRSRSSIRSTRSTARSRCRCAASASPARREEMRARIEQALVMVGLRPDRDARAATRTS